MKSLVIAIAMIFTNASSMAASGSYPVKPIRLIVPSAAGGGTDIVARLISREVGASLDVPVIVDNRPGVAGIFGTNLISKAAPDGYTIGMAQPALTISKSLYAKLPYDAERDLTPIVLANESANILAVYPSLPVRSIADLVALAKTRPLNGACNIASVQHLLTEMLNQATGIDIKVIAYKGGALATNDVIGGRVELMWSVMPLARPFVDTGKLRAIAVASAKRSAFLPNVQTTAEAGWPGITGTAWNGVVAPSGTPREIISRLNREIADGLSGVDAKERFQNLAMEAFQKSTPREFGAFLKAETAKWSQVVERAHMKLE